MYIRMTTALKNMEDFQREVWLQGSLRKCRAPTGGKEKRRSKSRYRAWMLLWITAFQSHTAFFFCNPLTLITHKSYYSTLVNTVVGKSVHDSRSYSTVDIMSYIDPSPSSQLVSVALWKVTSHDLIAAIPTAPVIFSMLRVQRVNKTLSYNKHLTLLEPFCIGDCMQQPRGNILAAQRTM